jgi:serine/threonine protein kinase
VAGRYRLRRLLGHGGMGAVWLAHDETLHRPVAIKQVLLTGLETGEERSTARARLLREARLAARVNHPGTVQVYDLVEEAGHPWIVMEALPGRTLEAALREDGPLPVDQATSIGLRLLDALQATHRAGIVHRDVKPSNLQLCDGPRVVLTDFGIASATDDRPGGSTCTIVGVRRTCPPSGSTAPTSGPRRTSSRSARRCTPRSRDDRPSARAARSPPSPPW